MIKIYRNISIFKKDNATGSQPTHDVTASDEKFENKVTVASLWTKDGAKGKFLSGQMKKEYKSEKGTYPAYVIVQEDELNELIRQSELPPLVMKGDELVERVRHSSELEGLDKINQKDAENMFGSGMTDEELKRLEDVPF